MKAVLELYNHKWVCSNCGHMHSESVIGGPLLHGVNYCSNCGAEYIGQIQKIEQVCFPNEEKPRKLVQFTVQQSLYPALYAFCIKHVLEEGEKFKLSITDKLIQDMFHNGD